MYGHDIGRFMDIIPMTDNHRAKTIEGDVNRSHLQYKSQLGLPAGYELAYII